MNAAVRLLGTTLLAISLGPLVMALAQPPTESSKAQPKSAAKKSERNQAKPQPRPHGERVKVDPASIDIDDGDSIVIKWKDQEPETVRILGIDTPETRHIEHNIPFDQPTGPEARAFAHGAFAAATEIELLRASTLDPYGRTLGYLFINGKNYSTLVLRAHLAVESITPYGDNGFPEIAREILATAKEAGPANFEPPYQYRNRMRKLSDWLKQNHQYPKD